MTKVALVEEGLMTKETKTVEIYTFKQFSNNCGTRQQIIYHENIFKVQVLNILVARFSLKTKATEAS